MKNPRILVVSLIAAGLTLCAEGRELAHGDQTLGNSQKIAAIIAEDEEDSRQIGCVDVSDEASVKEEEKLDRVYPASAVQVQPSFPGGEAAMYKWMADNIMYPAQAAEEAVEGRVVVEFVIAKDGSIKKVRVVRGRHPALDREAVRLVKSFPKWIPGQVNGESVNVTYCIPVSFKLQH